MNKKVFLKKLENNIRNCTKCRLYEDAIKAVPGDGNINAEIVFIGEAPGANEDKIGLPFVGRAGKLLESVLEEIGYARKDVWIGNIIKHRPPNNRDPLPDEIRECEKYLEVQLRVIKPLLIVTLGRFAMNYFYPDGKISRDRGVAISSEGYNVYPVYHPAAALRSTLMMNNFKEDFLRIPNVLKEIKNPKSDIVKKDITEEPMDGQLDFKL